MESFNVAVKEPTHVIIEIFGGDNNLSKYVTEDLKEFSTGNKGNVSMLAFCDYLDKGVTVLECHPSVGIREIAKLGELDTGDPRVLVGFLSKALRTYKDCPFVALGFWDHGSGVFDEDDPREISIEKRLKRVLKRRILKSKRANKLFTSNIAFGDRAMLNDDTNGGILTNYEAHQVVKVAIERSGFNRKINMIFSDMCLNGMIEVLCQFSDLCDTVVGSEDLEPADGWDYYQFANLMTESSPNNSVTWAYQAVEAYKIGYKNRVDLFPCTLAAFDTSKIASLVNSIAKLKDLIDNLGEPAFDLVDIIMRRRTQSFNAMDSYDIKDMAIQLKKKASDHKIKQCCDDIINAFELACIHNINFGSMVKNAYGLAIWYPRNSYQLNKVGKTYKKLEFDKRIGWTDFINKYF